MRINMLSIFYSFMLYLILVPNAYTQTPQAAPVRPVVDEYHGTEITDPYRYMENLDDPEVQAWMKVQAEYASSILKKIPGRDRLLLRIQELESATVSKVSDVVRLPNGNYFYRKRMADENVYKLYMRDGMRGIEKLLFDPETLQESTGKPHAINDFTPSPDGRYVAYCVSASGSEDASLYILETSTGRRIDKPIDRAQGGATGWLGNSSGFFYWRRQKLTPNASPTEKYQNSKSYFHKLGTDPENDEVVFGIGVQGVAILPTEFPIAITYPGCNFAFGIITTGVSPECSALYMVPLSKVKGPRTPWIKICEKQDKISDFDVHGDELYLSTFKDAPRFKVIKTSLSEPDLTKADTVIAEGESVVQDMAVAKDALYVQVLDGGIGRIIRVPFDKPGSPIKIPLPLNGTVELLATHPEIEGTFFTLASYTRAPAIYLYDPVTNAVQDTKLQPLGKYDAPDDLVSIEIKTRSHDGVMVPLSIIHKKGMKMDGKNPTYLVGYGAYGVPMRPYFRVELLSWLEIGGILAFAHVRGGGEYGEEWHMGGYKKSKPNTWKDFIACAEYLVNHKFTSPDYLAGMGVSAGGILIGRALTERPDLFTVAVPRVGCLDMLRAESTSNGVPNIPEFGTVKDAEEFKALLEMSAFHHVKNGVEYPAVLLTHGMNDPRVEPWNSAKMTARLQAASSSNKPILLRLDFESGHGIGSTKLQLHEEFADVFSFILWQCGVEGFQPL